MTWLARTVAVLLVLILTAAASADTIRLRDGRVLEGTIVSETRSKVVFDAMISNITTRMTFRRSEIESIEKGEAPTAKPTRERNEPRHETRAIPSTTEPRERYLVVPIHGVFGEKVGPEGVRNALSHAARRGINHVVFHIDSPGGQVWAADEISGVMSDRDPSVRCYAVIDDAISAAIWVALGCERIFIREDGTIGGAVAYRQDTSTGAVEVDAKMNSILAAKLEGICARNGHPEAIARAMVVYEESLYVSEDGEGGFRFSNDRSDDAEELDSPTSVLTLTGKGVEEFGLGEIFDEDIDELGERLGLEGWELASEYGAAAMRRGERGLEQRAEVFEDRAKLYAEFSFWVERISDTDPGNATYQVHEGGAMTATSINTWRNRTDACLNACYELRSVIKELDATERKAKRLGIDEFVDREDIKEWRRDLDNYIGNLRRNRDRSSL